MLLEQWLNQQNIKLFSLKKEHKDFLIILLQKELIFDVFDIRTNGIFLEEVYKNNL